MATGVVGVNDGYRVTINALIKRPTLIRAQVLNMMNQEFLVDAVLRDGGAAPSGTVLYHQSTPLFVRDEPAILDEFGEIPTTNGSLGTPLVARVVRRALGLRISKTMRDRENIDAVNIQLTQIKNTMIRAWEDAFFSALIANPQVQTLTTDTQWSEDASHIRKDVSAAKYLIKNASLGLLDSAADPTFKQKFGYKADTLIISTETEFDFLNSDEVSKPYQGNIASQSLQYTGKLPNKFLDLDVVTSWRLSAYAPGSAVVLQRRVVGGISNERPLDATPLYPEGLGGNGGPTESFRTDVTRASAIFFDQPLAAVVIGGVGPTDLTGFPEAEINPTP